MPKSQRSFQNSRTREKLIRKMNPDGINRFLINKGQFPSKIHYLNADRISRAIVSYEGCGNRGIPVGAQLPYPGWERLPPGWHFEIARFLEERRAAITGIPENYRRSEGTREELFEFQVPRAPPRFDPECRDHLELIQAAIVHCDQSGYPQRVDMIWNDRVISVRGWTAVRIAEWLEERSQFDARVRN